MLIRNINLDVQPTLPQNTPDYGAESLKALELRKEREDKALYENLVEEENSLAQTHNHP